MPVHCALPGLTHAMFEHWLDLFFETARTLPNRAMAERAVELSQRIAQSLWYGYQLHRDPDRMPAALPQRDDRRARSRRPNRHEQHHPIGTGGAAHARAPSLHAFLELAFRPLYLAGAAWALIALGIWVWAPQVLIGPLQGIAWHAHEMLWGFIATIAVAFLMTAGANWTGINPLKGGALGDRVRALAGRAYRLPRRRR